MTIEERKRYNYVIAFVFFGFSLPYGGLGLWMYLDGVGPFQAFPPVFGGALSTLVFGLAGGWFIAGIVGGFWLGAKYVGRQSRGVIVLACVLSLITLTFFMLVGMFVAVPFAIYNWRVIKKHCVEPHIPKRDISSEPDTPLPIPQEADLLPKPAAEVYFESKITLNESIFKELERHVTATDTKVLWGFIGLMLFAVAGVALYIQQIGFAAFAFCVTLFWVHMCRQPAKDFAKLNVEREVEATGNTEAEITLTFLADRVKTYHAGSGRSIRIRYDDFVRFAETERTYTMFTKASQFIVVNKTALIQEGKSEAFLLFLRDRCKNMK